MTWHLVWRARPEDNYFPPLAVGDACFTVACEGSGAPDAMRSNFTERFRAELGGPPSGVAADLLHLASAVFTADVCIPREMGEDRWCREIRVHLPVEDPARWESACGTITELLGFLTGDWWSLELRRRESGADAPDLVGGDLPDVVSLFSGGLDSLVGAIDLLAAGKRVALVGHYGAGMTHGYQQRVAAVLGQRFPGSTNLLLFHAQPPNITGIREHEQTMRSRSFLFFSLGVGVASRVGYGTPLFVSENGLISLNVPLTGARAGSFSTRTTHPHYVSRFHDLLSALGLDHPLVLPYRHKTKGTMLRECTDQATLGRATPLTMSCAHPEGGRWDGTSPGAHCGYCYPCLIRRAAVAAAGTPDVAYTVDVLTEAPDAATQKGRDFRAVSMAVERFRGRPVRRALFDVLDSGPIPPDEIAAYTTMYRDGMKELSSFLAPGGS